MRGVGEREISKPSAYVAVSYTLVAFSVSGRFVGSIRRVTSIEIYLYGHVAADLI